LAYRHPLRQTRGQFPRLRPTGIWRHAYECAPWVGARRRTIFSSRAPDTAQHERREPGPILLCMGLFSRFCVQAQAVPTGGAAPRVRDI
jgi:hypothetical protein